MDSFTAFHKAGKPEAALKVLKQLTDNAINEKRFDDAGYYNWVLSMQYLEMCKEQNVMNKFVSYQRDASIYYAYHAIQKYLVKLKCEMSYVKINFPFHRMSHLQRTCQKRYLR